MEHATLGLMQSNRCRSFVLLLGVVLAGLLTASCTSSGSERSVTIYSGRTENLIRPILDRFEAETGIEVRVKYAQSSDLALTISEEGDKTPADVFLSQSPGAVGFLEELGMLSVLPDELLALVPETVRADNGRWIGFSGRQRVLVYNPDLVTADELPQSVFELTDAVWDGRLAIAPPNGSFQDFVTAMRVHAGDEATSAWLEGLAANHVQTYANNTAIVAAVGRGEIAAGLVNHYYNYRALAEDPDHNALNHQLQPDDPGSLLIITGAAILESSAHTEEAAELITWLLSDSAQRYFADETFEYPLVTGIPTAEGVPETDFSAVGSIDYGTLAGGLSATRDMIAAAGLEG